MTVTYGLCSQNGNPVPLKNVCVDVTVSGFVGHVQSTLHYGNQEDVAIETTFTFPLDDGAAVYRLEAEIEGRHIIAECQEKQQARQTYDAAIASGQTAMLLGEDEETSDIFTCTLGNLPPKTEAKLTLSYVLELPQEADGKLRFTLPTILNPRYDPGCRTRSQTRKRLRTGALNGGHLKGAEGAKYVPASDMPYTFTVTATVRGKLEVRSVTSVKDKLRVEYSPDRLEAKVRAVEDFQFDHDLSFLVEYEDTHKPQVILEKGDPEKSGFLQHDLLMVNFYPEIDETSLTSCGEYIFVIDRSGSMSLRNRMTNAKEALLLFLKSLPVGCYFNIVSFGSHHSLLFPGGSQEYNEGTLNTALKLRKSMQADMGGTGVLGPLQDIYSRPTVKGHPRQIFLLTDGEVWNVDDVIGITKRNAHNTRVFAVGIGEGASTSLVNGVARAGKGKAEFIADSERMQPKVMSLLKCAMQPSITSLNVSWKLPAGVSAVTMPPTPPRLFGGERLILYALLHGTAKIPKSSYALTIKGRADKEVVNFNVYFDLDRVDSPHGHAPLHRLAAKAQIKQLQDTEDENKDGNNKITKTKIIQLSKASNIVSRHTSFVAVDKDRKERIVGTAMLRDVPVPMEQDTYQQFTNSSKSKSRKGITVRTMFGTTFTCSSLSGMSTIWDLKRKIRDTEGLAICRQNLVCDRQRLEDNTKLSKICTQEVHLFIQQVGGGSGPDPAIKGEFDEELEKERKGEKRVKQSMMGDKLMAIVSLQTFRGSWELSTDVCALLGVDMEKVKKCAIFKDMTLVVTLLVVTWLTKKFSSRKDEWEMIAGKAIGWMKSHDLEGKTLDLCLNESRKLLIGTDTV